MKHNLLVPEWCSNNQAWGQALSEVLKHKNLNTECCVHQHFLAVFIEAQAILNELNHKYFWMYTIQFSYF